MAGRIVVAPNGVLTPELERMAAEEVPDRTLFRADCPVVLAVGRLSHVKDFGTLIRAFALVRREHLARLVILGEGPKRKRLEALVRKLGLENDVRLPGFVKNPYAYMARARLLVVSSLTETGPNVLIEALACGIPVVATDCDYGPREILQGRWFGSLVPVRDPVSMAGTVLERLRSTPRPVDAGNELRCYRHQVAAGRFWEIVLGT
jgi:glycosyltransferase involved in cell wall biosynthesis